MVDLEIVKQFDMFVKFAKVCFERYQHKVKYWMTFNEINNQADVTQHNLIQEGAVLLKEGDDAEYLMYLSAHHEFSCFSISCQKQHMKSNPDFTSRMYDWDEWCLSSFTKNLKM